MRRRRPYSHRRQKRSLELLWPFLVIILIGVIVILLIQFVMTWMDQRQAELKNKVYFYLDEGTAQVLPWGDTEWTKAYDQLVLEGDVIRTGPASQGVLTFFNDTTVRLDADRKLEIEKIDSSKDEDVIYLDLETGRAWMNVVDKDDPLRFVVMTDNVRVTSFGTIFEVGLTDRESVRVMDGEVMVEVLENSSDREIVLEQVKVGVGQQVEVTARDIQQIQARQPVSLLEAIDDVWKGTPWFLWNQAEDMNPTLRDPGAIEPDAVVEEPVAVEEEEVVESPVEVSASIDVEEVVIEEEVIDEEVFDALAPVVKISVPTVTPYTLTDEEAATTFSIRGTTSANTAKVTVTSYDTEGNASPYVLSHFKAGDTTWRYGAANEFGNLREGRNLYTVVSENASGVKSTSVEVIVNVPEGAFKVEEVEEGADVVGDEDTPAESVEEVVVDPLPEDVVEETVEEVVSAEPLTVPVVLSLNGDSLPSSGRYSSSGDVITVLGSVSESAQIVYVDNYQLSKYVPGSGEWSYVVRPDFLNYDVGLNTYTVVAEDAEGNQESFTFEIYRVAP